MSQEPEQLDPEILNRAEELIDQAAAQFESDDPDLSQVEGSLRQALELLEDQEGLQAQDARSRAGEIWRSLVENTPDMDRCEQLLQEGITLFSDLPVSELLTSMLKRKRQISSIKEALTVPPGRDWAEWFEEPNAHEWLQSLLHTMDELLQEPSWPILKEQTAHYKEILLKKYLPAYIGPLPEEAHRQARRGDFARALQTTQKTLQFYPEELAPHITESVDRQSLHQLKDAIEARQRAEVALWMAIVKIVGQSSSISESLSGIGLELPDHPDVAVDDLRATLSDLEKAARIEGTFDEISDQDIYQLDYQDLKRRSRVHFSTLENPAGFLSRSDPQIVRELQSILNQLREKTTNAPEHVVQQLVSELEWPEATVPQDITTLLKPYWHLVGLLERGVLESPDLENTAREALAVAQRKPQGMLLRTAELFENTQNEGVLSEFLRMLNAIRLLNQGLARYPRAGDTNRGQSDMPPLPEGMELPASEPQLSDDALGRWEEIANTWLGRPREGIPPPGDTQDRGDAADLEWLEHGVQEYLHDVYELRHDIWPALALPPWGENSLPGKIKSDCELFLQSTAALRVVKGELESRSALDSIRALKSHLIDPGLIEMLGEPVIWLLKPYRSLLRQHVQTVQGAIESPLEDEIGQILDGRPPSADQLREVLTAGLSRELALVVRQSIEEQASSLARVSRGRGNNEAALAVWGAVRQATRPWADPQAEITSMNEGTGDLWRDLHRRATWGYRQAFLFARPRWAMAGGVALVVVLVVLGFAGRALLGWVRDSGRPVVAVANTSTSTAMASQTLIPTSTQDLRGLTETAVSIAAAGTATQQVLDGLAASGTARAQITATALQGAILGQTATAQVLQATEIAENATATAAADPAYQATAAALRCLSDPSAYSLEIIEGPELNPDLGSLYVPGDPVFSATASWTVRNTGECDWEQLVLEPFQDAREVNYFFWGESEQIEITSENPLEVGQSVKILLAFPILQARDINEAWSLITNGLQIQNPPHLVLEVDDWIIVVSPSPTPTPKTGGKPSPTEPKPTAKPSEPPPTARPSEPPPTARP